MPAKLFYKPLQNEWFGIAFLEEKERLYKNQKYCGPLIYERAGIIVSGMYDTCIHGSHWEILKIDDFDLLQYIK